MPNYNPNYVYSPRYGSRYMGNRIPSPAMGGAGQQDPMSAPINYEAGAQAQSPAVVGQTVDGGQGVAPTNAPVMMDTSMGAVGWTGGTGRDTSAISNLGDFGFRGLATGDPFDEGYFQTPTTPDTVTSPVTGAPEVPQMGTSSGDSTIPKASWSIVDNDPLSSGYQFIGGPSNFTPGNYNIAGSSENGGLDFEGNRKGYSNWRTSLGYGLGQYADIPILPGALIAGAASNMLLDHGTTNIPGVGNVGTTAGSFDAGAFSGGDGSPTDVSGGASGGDVGYNQYGDAVSIGYGYGQVDPMIARAAGFTSGVPVEERSTAFDRSVADVDMSGMNADQMAAAIEANPDFAKSAEGRYQLNQMQQMQQQQEQTEYNQAVSQLDQYGVAYDPNATRQELQAQAADAKVAHDAAVALATQYGVSTSGTTSEIANRATNERNRQAALSAASAYSAGGSGGSNWSTGSDGRSYGTSYSGSSSGSHSLGSGGGNTAGGYTTGGW